MKAAERKRAMELGETLYYTNVPCKHGHLAARRTITGTCVECERVRQASPSSRAYHRKISRTPKYVEQRKAYRKTISGSHTFKERTRGVHLKNKYGLTLEEHFKMFQEQNEKCAICAVQMEIDHKVGSNKTRCVVDHDHKTGKVRKLLCGQCNRMIGQANESVDILQQAIWYLQTHNGLCDN